MRIQAMAARSRGDELVPWTYEQAALGPFDCLLRVLACGLCSSDLHMVDNHWSMSHYPLVPGHEVIGEVVDIGSRVNQVSIGDRVGAGWQRSACFQCHDCVSGREASCLSTTPEAHRRFPSEVRPAEGGECSFHECILFGAAFRQEGAVIAIGEPAGHGDDDKSHEEPQDVTHRRSLQARYGEVA